MTVVNTKTRGRFLIILTALLWALAGICIKSIDWGPVDIICVRSFISLLIMLIANRGFSIKLTKTNLLCGLMIALTSFLYVTAVKFTTAGTAIILQYIAPILVYLYEVAFRGRKAKTAEIIITICVFTGCVLTFMDSIDMTHVLGNILALLSSVTFAAQIIIMNGSDSDSMDGMIIGNFLCFAVALPMFLSHIGTLAFDAKNITWILILSIFQYGCANLLFTKGCKLIDSVECSLLLTVEPVFNPVLVALFNGEMMGPLAILGACIVIAANTCYTLLPRMEKYVFRRR